MGSGGLERIGQFDKSFVIRTLRDFCLTTLAILLLVLGMSYVLTQMRFQDDGQAETRYAAERLADDVRSIMLNEGGPVAARTVYPILHRNHESQGLHIAILPSQVTVTSIRKRFDKEAKGLPPEWPDDGRFHEHTVHLSAEPPCIRCHMDAQVGDDLGHVTVRNYASTFMERWWQDLRIDAFTGLFNITISAVVVFILLRARMEPLLSLRAVVSRLAKGEMRLSRRAPVKSEDEFGELAFDLNQLLTRICDIVDELEQALELETGAGADFSRQVERAREQMVLLRGRLQALSAAALPASQSPAAPDLAASLDEVADRLRQRGADPVAVADELHGMREAVAAVAARQRQLQQALGGLSEPVSELSDITARLGSLAERLQRTTAAEQRLLERLR
ncbi:methyl-accepting chemotaxis protein [Aquisalimonas sp.]|uniref:HAMP domain-containing protein n=1 Tax=Aquisalimonas sp. TaxID=1872621 RepID=UPI0025C44D01|nr:methyl-accepting chemotaxis protein [Aquisalimonas sp.]